MLRKLMKYEFMATGRVFLPVYAALIAVSIVSRILQSFPATPPAVIANVASSMMIAGIGVITLLLTFQRFRNNLLSNEGYLMMTLPVSTNKLILSKMFVAAIWCLASFIVVASSIMIMAFGSFSIVSLFVALSRIFEQFALSPLRAFVHLVEVILSVAFSLFLGILLLYTCMSLSMLVNRRRGLFTFGAFIVITTVVQILISILNVFGIPGLLATLNMNIYEMIHFSIIVWLVVLAAFCAGFYSITRYMLGNRLNLQ